MFNYIYNIYKHYNKIKQIIQIINNINNDKTEITDDICVKLKNNIMDGGCIYIKFAQWYISNMITNDNGRVNKLNKYFESIFDQCPYHELSYTELLFEKDFNMKLEDYIDIDSLKPVASGTIGQVYSANLKLNILTNTDRRNIDNEYNNNSNAVRKVAIKVKHPEIDINVRDFTPFINLISYLQSYPYLRKKLKLFFNFESFINDINMQTQFINEVNNANKFREIYKDNCSIYIPKIYKYTDNIIISEFVDCVDYNSISDYKKNMVSLNFVCLIKDMLLINNFIHGDLHHKNWGVILDDSSIQKIPPKIVLFDFGICYTNDDIQKSIDVFDALELDDSEALCKAVSKYIVVDNNNCIDDLNTKLIQEIKKKGMEIGTLLSIIVEFLIKENVIIESFMLNILISLILIENLLKKNDIFSCGKTDDDNGFFQHINSIKLDIISYCETYIVYPDLLILLNQQLESRKDKNKDKVNMFDTIKNSNVVFLPIS